MKKLFIFLLIILSFNFFPSSVNGIKIPEGSVSFRWDFHTGNINGYRLYQSNESGDYFIGDPNDLNYDPNKMVAEIANDPNDIESSTNVTISGVLLGTHFWILNAFANIGEDELVSPPSNEVWATICISAPTNLWIYIP